VLSTRSCRTNSTWRSATSNAAVGLGETRLVELSLRIDQDDLLECVHCPENRVQGAVCEAEQLVRSRALGSGQPLAQRGLGERHT